MGLDQFAYRVKKGFIKHPVDFVTEKYNEETEEHEVLVDKKELHYWRKHPHLQGWMEELYYEKGGESDTFNCVNVQLTWEDLENLEQDIKTGKLPETCGFFFLLDTWKTIIRCFRIKLCVLSSTRNKSHHCN